MRASEPALGVRALFSLGCSAQFVVCPAHEASVSDKEDEHCQGDDGTEGLVDLDFIVHSTYC